MTKAEAIWILYGHLDENLSDEALCLSKHPEDNAFWHAWQFVREHAMRDMETQRGIAEEMLR